MIMPPSTVADIANSSVQIYSHAPERPEEFDTAQFVSQPRRDNNYCT